jgi:hypothetical protein
MYVSGWQKVTFFFPFSGLRKGEEKNCLTGRGKCDKLHIINELQLRARAIFARRTAHYFYEKESIKKGVRRIWNRRTTTWAKKRSASSC